MKESGLYGGYWSVSQPNLWSLSLTRLAVLGRALSCKRLIPSYSIPGHFNFMARRSTLIHQETNHTSLLFFACLHFQCWTNTLYTTLTSRVIKKQLWGPVCFHYACLLPYRCLYRYVTTVLPAFVRNVLYGGQSVFIWLPLYLTYTQLTPSFSSPLASTSAPFFWFTNMMTGGVTPRPSISSSLRLLSASDRIYTICSTRSVGLPAEPMYTTAGRRRYVRASRSTAGGIVAVNITVWNTSQHQHLTFKYSTSTHRLESNKFQWRTF